MVAIIPVIFMILGLILWLLPVPAKVQEMGKILFGFGFLVTMFVAAGHTVKLL